MRAAGRLILSASNELAEAPPQAYLQIVNLELVTRAASSVLREFVGQLAEVRVLLNPKDCPHCGFSRRYRTIERCPRCGGLRGVSRESALSDPVHFARSVRKLEGSR